MSGWRDIVSLAEFMGILLFTLAFLLVTVYLQKKTIRADLVLELQVEQKGVFQVYWQAEDEQYLEKNSRRIVVDPAVNEYVVRLPPVLALNKIRIDPFKTEGQMEFIRAELKSARFADVDLLAGGDRLPLLNMHQLEVELTDRGFKLVSQGRDPYFEINFPQLDKVGYFWPFLLGTSVLAALLLSVILNQHLLKGGKHAGVLKISLPKQTVLQLPEHLVEGQPFKARNGRLRIRREQRDDMLNYYIEFKRIQPQDVCALSEWIHRTYPQASCLFQYNRSCEV